MGKGDFDWQCGKWYFQSFSYDSIIDLLHSQCPYQNIMSGWSKSHTQLWRTCVYVPNHFYNIDFFFTVPNEHLLFYSNFYAVIFNAIQYWKILQFSTGFFFYLLTSVCNISTDCLCWNTQFYHENTISIVELNVKSWLIAEFSGY